MEVKFISGLLVLVVLAVCCHLVNCATDPTWRARIEWPPFIADGTGAVRWNWQAHKLTYIRVTNDTYFNVFVSDEDGSHERALTYGNPLLPGRHAGAHDFHPSGQYVMFVAEKRDHPCAPFVTFNNTPVNQPLIGCSYPAIPGFGGFSDIWLISIDGQRAWQLTNTSATSDSGILLPQFSWKGDKVVWCERVKAPQLGSAALTAGTYVIRIADFVIASDGSPSFQNIQTYNPGGLESFHEITTWSRDDAQLYLCSDYLSRDFNHNQLFLWNPAVDGNGTAKVLTNNTAYAEHAHVSPDGSLVVFMSSQGDYGMFGTDWWVMNPDGSNQRQLTYMNHLGDPQAVNGSVYAGSSYGWAPDLTYFYGDIQTSLTTQAGVSTRIWLPSDLVPVTTSPFPTYYSPSPTSAPISAATVPSITMAHMLAVIILSTCTMRSFF